MPELYKGCKNEPDTITPESDIKESFDHMDLGNFTVELPDFVESEEKRKGRGHVE